MVTDVPIRDKNVQRKDNIINMWLENIIEAKNKLGISVKDMSKRSRMGLSEKTINRVLTKETPFPRLDTVLDIGSTVGLSGHDIFAETTSVISDPNIVAALQAELNTLKAENAVLKDKVDTLKDEVIATHNYYIKLKSNN